MKRTPKNLIYHELIGLEVQVLHHLSENYVGLKGIVIDETKNSLLILTSKGDKRILKKGGKFLFKLSDKVYALINGEDILARPEERVKMIKWR